MATFEFAQFTATDKYIADQTSLNPALDATKNINGLIDYFHGLQVEDSKTAYFFVSWESVEHHLAITKHPKYPELVKNLHPFVQPGSVSFQHVKFNKDPSTTSFAAPVTEVAVITFKSATSEEIVKTLEVVSKALDEAKGQVANAYGESVENKGVWFIVVGWESIEAHAAAVKLEPFPTIVGSHRSDTEIQMAHARFIKH